MNILIIGAGAAGLMAAHLLSKQGHHITILEARSRIGGRIHTKHDGRFSKPMDLGAEFVHGNLPLTLDLLKEAGITYHNIEGEMWHFREGRFFRDEDYFEHWPELIEKLEALREDLPIKAFLAQEFPGTACAPFRQSIEQYVQGLDAADPADASTFALRKEWSNEDEDQYRIEGGYGRLMDYLLAQSRANGAALHLAQVVKELRWQHGVVSALTTGGEAFHGDKAIITLPVGVLQAALGEEGAVTFLPGIPGYAEAVKAIGNGNAIKVLLQFREAFWKENRGHDLEKLGFILSDAAVPTWWTQYPEQSALLTGWIGGPKAYAFRDLTKEELLRKAIQSLAEIFGIPEGKIKNNLDGWAVADWPAYPYSRGSYSYATVATSAALAFLKSPVSDTIYFAGEAIYNGPSMGTAEAAFTSAKEVAAQIGAA